MTKNVSVDNEICTKTAELIRELSLRNSFYERPFLRVSAPEEIRLRGYFYAVAICHQTYNLQNKNLGLFGWDYLEQVFTRLMVEQANILKPGALASMPIVDLENQLAGLFSPDGIPEHTTLDRLEERCVMLVELDRLIVYKFESRLVKLMASAGNKLMNDGNGFYELLPIISAFEDPLRKKITFLIKLLQEAEIITILDPENYIPIMDYHMQRVLLRIGCVEVNDQELRRKLINRSTLQSDEEIRKACINAFGIIAGISGYPVTKMNDFFWSLGRSCCNETPLCQAGRCEKEPCTFFEIVGLKSHTECYFKSACKGYSDKTYRELWQPMVDTHYY
jgi:hypothetical protein